MKRSASSPILPVAWQKNEYLTVLVIFAVCGVAALWAAQGGASLKHSLIINNSIGLSQWAITILVRLFFRGRMPAWSLVIAIPVGYVLGSRIASLTGAPDIALLMFQNPVRMRQFIVASVLIGVAITAFFLYFSHSIGVRQALDRERLRAAEALQAETAARLALLQAQIEPHFLFNTLANIHSLIKADPDTASQILEQLNKYLRTSLSRTRAATGTVGDELELVETLLGIAAARLGKRFDYMISSPAELRDRPLPPLLLQPLVENAIRHGIEPAVDGGTIGIEVADRNGALELTVTDTGVGLDENKPQGVGLANVRARLERLYEGKGRLAIYTNVPRGVIAKLTIPAIGAGQ